VLVCALLVWIVFPFEYYEKNMVTLRNSYLTEIDCINSLSNNQNYCILIDKRKDFLYEEWLEDNCSRSEHEWIGK